MNLCAVSSCRLVCLQKLYCLAHACIKGLWIIKQMCIFFVTWSKELWSFLHSGSLFLFSLSGFEVYRDSDVMWDLLFGIISLRHEALCVLSLDVWVSSWERDWRWCPQEQILCSHKQPLCMTVSERERGLLPLRRWLTLSLGLFSWWLSLHCSPQLWKQLMMDSCHHLLGLRHSWCNLAILWTTLSIRPGNTALDKKFLPLSHCVSCGRRVMVSTELGSKFIETKVKTFISCSGFWIGPLRSCFKLWREHSGPI